jgi:hypothetical protein
MSNRLIVLFVIVFTVFNIHNSQAQNVDVDLGGNNDQVGFYIINSDNDTIFTCKANGRIGIGVKSPTNILNVVSPTGGEGISVVNSAGDSRILLSIAGGDWGFMELHDEDGYRAYMRANGISLSNGSEYFTIDESGGFFQSNTSTGKGVHGSATATGEITNYGGYFETAGSEGQGVYGVHTSSGNFGYLGSKFIGVYGKGNTGILGTGVIGVSGVHDNGNRGDLGNLQYGVRATAMAVGAAGIYAKGGSGGFAGEFDGPIKCEYLEIVGGSDIAEPFDIVTANEIKPGMVMSIDNDNPGKLKISSHAYDRCVAGIVSGAGGIQPGMVMSQTGSIADGEMPITLTGRVYCWAEADNNPIEPGDLLTTSDIPGFAMKVTDHIKAHGAIIGKSMGTLEKGRGLILVLVTLH